MDRHRVGEENPGVTRGERVDSAFLLALPRWVPGTQTVVLCLGGQGWDLWTAVWEQMGRQARVLGCQGAFSLEVLE